MSSRCNLVEAEAGNTDSVAVSRLNHREKRVRTYGSGQRHLSHNCEETRCYAQNDDAML